MTSIAAVDSVAVRALQLELASALTPGVSLEAACQTCASFLYDEFRDSVALVRVFASIRFADLPPRESAAAMAAAGSTARDIGPDSPILALLGTRGAEAAWNDRRRSSGHVAIPVASAAFVAGAPMITRLFRELGADVQATDADVQRVVERVIGGTLAGVFLVDDAATAVDQRGRMIIPAQDFVKKHGVRSVFGVGGSYLAGTLVVVIFFAKEQVARSTADLFTRFVSGFKKATMRQALEKRYFDTGQVRTFSER